MERRLAAIFAADVVGYSRLIGADEAGTLAALRGLLKELVEPVLKRRRGRVVKLMGDGLLAEFASVVDAVAAAVEIQEAMPERSAHSADDRRIALRIGVNTGDIVVEGGDIFGDGVNIAARLQEIAEPDGVAISDGARRELRGKLDLPFKDAGEKVLKNIEEPVRTWIWSQNFTSSVAPEPDQSLSLSDKPSIAVLPFANMSGDAEQEYFADGMTEDIITSLSRFRSLFVIARNSTFAYKGKSPDVREVARELGVRYILEGSVRRGGDRIRITGQLIDAETATHLWAERYDRELQDIFTVQDEITQTVVGSIAPELARAERDRATIKRPDSLDAWDLYQRGAAHLWDQGEHGQPPELEKALKYFTDSTALDPRFSPAYSGIAFCHFYDVLFGLTDDRQGSIETGFAAAKKAVELDQRDSFAYGILAGIQILNREPEEAIRTSEIAIKHNPSHAQSLLHLGMALVVSGKASKGVQQLDAARDLSPNDTFIGPAMAWTAIGYLVQGEFKEAADWARKSLDIPRTQIWGNIALVSAIGHLGEKDEAGWAVKVLLRRRPDFTPAFIKMNFPGTDPDSIEILIDGLRKAGVPDG